MSEITHGDVKFLRPIHLDFEAALEDDDRIVRILNSQIREALGANGAAAERLRRAVYVVRMTGSFIIQYSRFPSPVLYIGRGNASTRLAQHLQRWLCDVHTFGSDASVELRIVVPRRRNKENYYMNVEADLLHWFVDRYGQLPMINRRKESSYASRVDHKAATKPLKDLITTGKGYRPQWAIKPLPSNPLHKVYNTGPSLD